MRVRKVLNEVTDVGIEIVTGVFIWGILLFGMLALLRGVWWLFTGA